MRVLIVEDERKVASVIDRALQRVGFAVDVATDGEEALWRGRSSAYDAIVLDRLLPGVDGIGVLQQLRADRVATPVLMLTALGEVDDRVSGLDAGADDYLAKPFDVDELVARVRALTRRTPAVHPPVLEAGDLRLDPATHRAWRGDAEVRLTPKEFALLEVLMRNQGFALSRFALLEHVWGDGYERGSNAVDVHVGKLRDKVDRAFGRHSIETVRAVGYRLVDG